MNYMYKLISSGVISFNDTLIENYQLIGLSELESMILLKLSNYSKTKNSYLCVSDLKKEVTISEEELSNLIFSLVQKGYINLSMNNLGTEEFSLDPTYEKLGNLLNELKIASDCNPNEDVNALNNREELIRKLAMYIEATLSRCANEQDLQYINMWVDKNYTFDEMKDAILESAKAKKAHIKYADAVLTSRHQVRESVEPDPEIQRLLQNVYVKKRY